MVSISACHAEDPGSIPGRGTLACRVCCGLVCSLRGLVALGRAHCVLPRARLAQSAERKALNLVVVGSSPTVGVFVGRFWDVVVVWVWLHKWTHWGLNPGPSACKADVIPLHHVPDHFPHSRLPCCMLRCPALRCNRSDTEGIRTPAGRAQWISSPSP